MTDRPLRIAIVINDLLMGGAQQAVAAILDGIDRSRFDPVVYCLNRYGRGRPTLEAEFAARGIEVRWLSTGKTGIFKAAARLARRFRDRPPAIVHTHLVDATLAGIVGARLAGVPAVVVHEHQTHRMYSWRVRVAYRLLRRFVTLTLCYAPAVEEELFGTAAELTAAPASLPRHATIRNGVDIARLASVAAGSEARATLRAELGLGPDTLLVTSVARLVPWKGQRWLVDGFAQVADAFPRAHLCLVGEGPEREPLLDQATRAGVRDRVHLLGARSDASRILAASDIAPLVMRYERCRPGETIGLAGMEALALGVPLIAGRHPGGDIRVVDGVNAILVPPGDPAALADALTRLLGDPELRARIGAEGAATARRSMDWKSIIPIYEGVYSLLVAP